MTKPLPKWLILRYALLWNRREKKKFDFRDSQNILAERNDKTLSVVLSNLKKHGWMDVELHPRNGRKRTYCLKPPSKIMKEIAEKK